MQAARDLVGLLVELPPGVEVGHDDLGCRYPFFAVNLGRDAAAVVAHRHRAIGIQHHLDAVAEAADRLVDGVVDNLVDHVMQARAVVGIADVHARTLAHGVKTAQDLDGVGAVFRGPVFDRRLALRRHARPRFDMRPWSSARN